MEVSQIIEKKSEFERSIVQLLLDFNRATGLEINGIYVGILRMPGEPYPVYIVKSNVEIP